MTRKINFIIPACGDGKRFSDAGFSLPKPLIDVNGIPMIQRVVQNCLSSNHDLNKKLSFHIIMRSKHVNENSPIVDNFLSFFHSKGIDVRIYLLDSLTDGAATTVYHVSQMLNESDHMVVCNSDQLVLGNSIASMINASFRQNASMIMCFKCNDEDISSAKWSYADVAENGLVSQVVEKKPLFHNATVGVYSFSSVAAYNKAYHQMVKNNDRTNGEFYLCPVYNYVHPKKAWMIDRNQFLGLGTPKDYEQSLFRVIESSGE